MDKIEIQGIKYTVTYTPNMKINMFPSESERRQEMARNLVATINGKFADEDRNYINYSK